MVRVTGFVPDLEVVAPALELLVWLLFLCLAYAALAPTRPRLLALGVHQLHDARMCCLRYFVLCAIVSIHYLLDGKRPDGGFLWPNSCACFSSAFIQMPVTDTGVTYLSNYNI